MRVISQNKIRKYFARKGISHFNNDSTAKEKACLETSLIRNLIYQNKVKLVNNFYIN